MKCLQIAVKKMKYILYQQQKLQKLNELTRPWSLNHLFKRNAVIDQGLEIKLIENTNCVCKDGWLVIPKPLQVHAVKWYHHYLQHPGHTRLKETMNAAMYWKSMHTTIWSLTKSCKSCQINTRQNRKYGHLPPQTIITNPWLMFICQPHWSIHS